MTGLDANRETKVGAYPSGIMLDGIPQGIPTSMEGPDWLEATGMVEVATSEMTVLWGGVVGVGEDWLCAAMTNSISVVNLTISSFSSLFSFSRCSIILG